MPAARRNVMWGAPLGESSAVRFEQYQDEQGSICLWQHPSVRLYSTRVDGYLSIGLAKRIIDYVEPLFEKGRVIGFHDWFQMVGYDTASRSQLTTWSLRRSALAQINIGTRAKLVSMGVTVAAMALGEHVLRRFRSEAELEAAYQEALRAGGA